jgi:3-phenylpropionate/trans-cinnamate dioxygenase ferredoxin reductase component
VPDAVVIIGAGQAAAQAAISLRQGGFDGAIDMLGDELAPPYQRPPLSKKYLSGELPAERLLIRDADAWAGDAVSVHTGQRASTIDLAARRVTLEGGAALSFTRLIIATGSRPRPLPVPGADLRGVHVLRTLADVDALRADLPPGARLVIIGAGYIGLETAAVASALGATVTVLEAAPRCLARVTHPMMSEFYADVHRQHGVTVITDARTTEISGSGGRVTGVALADGRVIAADAVLVGIGIIANTKLATGAGIAAEDGILVDEDARTSAPDVFAIGDCAKRPLVHFGHRMARLESVHNALEQGKLAAAAILGAPRPNIEAPWFWSDQYDLKLQIAGLSQGSAKIVMRGDQAAGRFAAFALDETDRILAVDAVNAPAEFLGGKQLIARAARVAPQRLGDTSISMKEIAAGAQAPQD